MRTNKILVFAILLLFNISNVSSQNETEISNVHGLSVGVATPMFTAIDYDSIEFILTNENTIIYLQRNVGGETQRHPFG
jgi:hypothetical protein